VLWLGSGCGCPREVVGCGCPCEVVLPSVIKRLSCQVQY
jgi:hypothetical protein